MRVSLANVHVMLGIPLHRGVSGETLVSLWGAHEALLQAGVKCSLRVLSGSSIVTHVRSKIAAEFLQSDATHLFWFDSDMVAAPEAFVKHVALGVAYPVVTAVYRAKREAVQYFVDQSVRPPLISNAHGLLPVWGGLGFTVVQRVVMEALAAKAPLRRLSDSAALVPAIFRFDVEGEAETGEDMNFFRDCLAAGFPVWCDPTVVLGHVGEYTFSGAFSDKLMRQVEAAE